MCVCAEEVDDDDDDDEDWDDVDNDSTPTTTKSKRKTSKLYVSCIKSRTHVFDRDPSLTNAHFKILISLQLFALSQRQWAVITVNDTIKVFTTTRLRVLLTYLGGERLHGP